MTSLLAHSIGLTLVLGHSGVDALNEIGADRREEYSRHGMAISRGSTIATKDRDGGSARHVEDWRDCKITGFSCDFQSRDYPFNKTENRMEMR